MKLIKIKSDSGRIYFCVTGLDIGKYIRTGRYRDIKFIPNVIYKEISSGLFESEFELFNETIIYELEFENVEDLIELIPEEFL